MRVSIRTVAGDEFVIIRQIGDTIRALKCRLELDRGFPQRQQRIFQRNVELEGTAELRSKNGKLAYEDADHSTNHIKIESACWGACCGSCCLFEGCIRIRSSHTNDRDATGADSGTVTLDLLLDDTGFLEELHSTIRLVLVGGKGVGKTATMFRYVHGDYTDQDLQGAPLNFNHKTKDLTDDDGRNIKLEIWDTRTDNHNDLAMQYVRSAHGVLVFYDVVDSSSFALVRNLVQEVVETRRNREPAMPFILVGNKQDLLAEELDAEPSLRPPPVSAADAQSLAEEYGGDFMEISAADNLNVDELFTTIAKKAMARELQRNTRGRTGAIDLNATPRPPRIICEIRTCCRTETVALPCSIL
jgi:Ras-related protein Rab-1A